MDREALRVVGSLSALLLDARTPICEIILRGGRGRGIERESKGREGDDSGRSSRVGGRREGEREEEEEEERKGEESTRRKIGAERHGREGEARRRGEEPVWI